MLAAATALTLLGGGLNIPFVKTEPQVRRYTPAPGWVLTVKNDRFVGVKTCSLRRGSVSYVNRVVTFHLGGRVNTAEARFRVDGGPARSVGEVAVQAAGRGVGLRTRSLRNPSGGQVHIPAELVQRAQSVAIHPGPGARVRTYQLRGLEASIDVAKAQGCANT